MKQYMEIGERGYYDKKRYRCVPAGAQWNCTKCDLRFYKETLKSLCKHVACLGGERPDKTNVMFVLQPKYRKEVKNG